MAHSSALGLPSVLKKSAPVKWTDRKLAVVGGGPSIADHLEELRSFDGEIWAINGARKRLAEAGIESTFLSMDPLPVIAESARGAKRAIVCSRCDPAVFVALQDAEVFIFHSAADRDDGIMASAATVLGVPDLATELGFRHIAFYGCEGSYVSKTHDYMDDPQTYRFVVECGGERFMTLPELYVVTMQLAEVIKAFPLNFTERSGGLLRAMIENNEHDVVQVSQALLASLKPLKEAA